LPFFVCLGVERFDQAQQTCPRHDLIYLGEEAFAACLLALAGVFEIGEAHLLICSSAHLLMGGSDQVVRLMSSHLGLFRRFPYGLMLHLLGRVTVARVSLRSGFLARASAPLALAVYQWSGASCW
jgi:hypothetical protein